jgi:D-sedoheptulose 7-phosphate isomerase
MERSIHLEELRKRYPVLKEILSGIEAACAMIVGCYERGGTVLICGNGGSSADSNHIVAELMKGFLRGAACPRRCAHP